MTTNGTPTIEETVEEHSQLYKITRKVVLAAFGAVGMASDELEGFVGKLVERGEIAEKDGRALVDEIREKGEERISEGRTRVQKLAGMQPKEEEDEAVEEVLHRMDIPTKTDIKELSAKIAALTRKVEELKASKN